MDLNEILYNRFRKQDYRHAVRVGYERFWDANTKQYNTLYYIEIELQDIKNIDLINIFKVLEIKDSDRISLSSRHDALQQKFSIKKTIENDIVLNDNIIKILNNIETFFKERKVENE